MVLSNAERQARHRAKAKAATTLIAAVEQSIALTERAIRLEQERYGTRPDEASDVGKLMAEQMAWVRRERAHLESLRGNASSFYDPET